MPVRRSEKGKRELSGFDSSRKEERKGLTGIIRLDRESSRPSDARILIRK
ncbi:hypothetical protein [Niallia oryzisoli]